MRVNPVNTGDPVVDKALMPIVSALSNISKDNFHYVEISGQTNATADTQEKFKHGLSAVPSLWLFLEGRVYVPRYGAGTDMIDIRSAYASEKFRILVIS